MQAKILIAFFNNLSALSLEVVKQLQTHEEPVEVETESNDEALEGEVVEAEKPAKKNKKKGKKKESKKIVEDADEDEPKRVIASSKVLSQRIKKLIKGGFADNSDLRVALNDVGAKNVASIEDHQLDAVWTHFEEAWETQRRATS